MKNSTLRVKKMRLKRYLKRELTQFEINLLNEKTPYDAFQVIKLYQYLNFIDEKGEPKCQDLEI